MVCIRREKCLLPISYTDLLTDDHAEVRIVLAPPSVILLLSRNSLWKIEGTSRRGTYDDRDGDTRRARSR